MVERIAGPTVTRRTAKAVFLVLLVLLPTLVPGGLAGALQTTYTTRTVGADRYATSALAALDAYPSGAPSAVIVSGADANWPDGLPAASLAGVVGGPVLLTDPDELSASTGLVLGQIVSTLPPEAPTVYIVGGTAAVSEAVEASIVALGYTVDRVAGADRYATAVAVARKVASLGTYGSFDGGKMVFLASGLNFPDALAVGPIAHSNVNPVLLVGDTLSTAVTDLLDDDVIDVQQVVVLGGTAAVAAAHVTTVQGISNTVGTTTAAIEVTRIGGVDRYDTAVEIAKWVEKSTVLDGLGWTVDNVILVSGVTHHDAMVSAALGSTGHQTGIDYPAVGSQNTVVLLQDAGNWLNSTTSNYLVTKGSHLESVRAVGTNVSISDAALTDAKSKITQSAVTVTASPGLGVSSVIFNFSQKVACTSSTSGADGADGGLKANYKLNNQALSGHYITCASNGLSATLYLGSALAANDVVTVEPLTSTGVADADGDGLSTVQTVRSSFTVEGAKPTGGIAYIESKNAYVAFDRAVVPATSDFVITDAAGNTNSVSSVTANLDNKGWALLTADNFTADDVIKVNTHATVIGTVYPTFDKSEASIASAEITLSSYTTAAANITAGTGDFKVTTKSTGQYPGVLGENWTVQLFEGTSTTAVLVDHTDKTIVIQSPIAITSNRKTAEQLVATLNATSTFNVDFTADEVTAGSIDVVQGATALTGGQSVHKIIVTMSEPILNTTWSADGTPAVTIDATADKLTDSGTSDVSSVHDWFNGTMVVTVTVTEAAQDLVRGTSLLQIATTAADIAGNVPTLVHSTTIS